MKTRKNLSLLFAIVFTLTLFAGCGNGSESSAVSVESTEIADSAETVDPTEFEESTISVVEDMSAVEESNLEMADPLAESREQAAAYFPLDETATLTGWGTLIPPVLSITDDLNDFLAYTLAEEATNIHIEWTSVSVIQQSEAFQLMVASGDYPDLLKGAATLVSGGVEAAISEEIIIDLAEYLDEYAPNYQTIRTSSEAYEKGSTTDSGIVGAFSYFASDVEACASKGGFIRQDWLDELGLDLPVTVEDYYEVLKAFHNAYNATYGLPAQGIHFGNMMESAYDISVPFANGTFATGFYQIDGEVLYGPAQEGYRNYLTEMAKWYAEGLISTDFMSDTDSGSSGTVADSLITNGSVGIFYGGATQYQNYVAAASDPDFALTPLPAAVLYEGQVTHTRGLSSSVGAALSISTDCSAENLENALRWCDWWYTEDGYIAANWGQEGLTFNYDENGDPVYTDIVLNNPDMDKDTSIVMYTMSEMGDHFTSDPRRIYQYYADGVLDIKMLWTEGDDNAYVIPSDISITSEESEILSTVMNEVYSYTNEMTLRFITGADDIEGSWDEYVETLDSLGIDDAAEIYSDCYTRYLER